MNLLTANKNSFLVLELQRQLKQKHCQPIWEILHKFHSVMGQRDSRYKLEPIVEMDESFFKIVSKEEQDEYENRKLRRGSQDQSKVPVMIESEPVDEKGQKKDRPTRKAGYLRMVVIPDLEGGTIDINAEECIDIGAEVVTDALPVSSSPFM